jgi:hypothetical protein
MYGTRRSDISQAQHSQLTTYLVVREQLWAHDDWVIVLYNIVYERLERHLCDVFRRNKSEQTVCSRGNYGLFPVELDPGFREKVL